MITMYLLGLSLFVNLVLIASLSTTNIRLRSSQSKVEQANKDRDYWHYRLDCNVKNNEVSNEQTKQALTDIIGIANRRLTNFRPATPSRHPTQENEANAT